MTWLTLEQAASLTQTSLEQLNDYFNPTGEQTTEEQFVAIGLLFDRERFESGHETFLKAIAPQNSLASSPESTDSYDFQKCTVKIAIMLLPHHSQESERQCIIATSIHEDLPITQMISWEQLQPLPEAITALLEQLKAELPRRKMTAELNQPKQKPTLKPHQPTSKPVETEPKPTQLNLF